VLENSLRGGACPSCGHEIPGRWESAPTSRGPEALQALQRAASKYGALNL